MHENRVLRQLRALFPVFFGALRCVEPLSPITAPSERCIVGRECLCQTLVGSLYRRARVGS